MTDPARGPTTESRSDDARSLWRVADQMRDRANALEGSATRLREQARKLDALAAALNDSRPLEYET